MKSVRKDKPGKLKSRSRKLVLIVTLCAIVAASVFYVTMPRKTDAFGGGPCVHCMACPLEQCLLAVVGIDLMHLIFKPMMIFLFTPAFNELRDWLTTDFVQIYIWPALKKFTEQMDVVAMYQAMMVGTLLDAKQQLEVQRTFQELTYQAQKDYNPTESFCYFGTNTRSLASSDLNAQLNITVLAERQISRQMGQLGGPGSDSKDQDKISRWNAFRENYCDPQDNNWTDSGTGLNLVCGNGPQNSDRINIDIDYTRLIEEPRTIKVSYSKPQTQADDDDEVLDAEPDSTDVLALSDNLYGHDVLSRNLSGPDLLNREYQHVYMALRSIAAKRAVAQNSFDSIVGLKSSSTYDQRPPEEDSDDDDSGDSDDAGDSGEDENAAPNTAAFMRAILRDMGVPPDEMEAMIGDDPSYYAQMEVLSKRLYQSPSFYADLYDAPTDIDRKSVSLKAIELILDRAMLESELRQEMNLSVLLSSLLHDDYRTMNARLPGSAKSKLPEAR